MSQYPFYEPNCISHTLDSQYMLEFARNILSTCRQNVEHGSIYNGSAGCAYVQLLHASIQTEKGDTGVGKEVRSAIRRAQKSLEYISQRRVSLLEGRTGPTALLLWAGALLGDEGMVDMQWRHMMSYGIQVTELPRGECEVLYGRCGYLHSLLLCKKVDTFGIVDLSGGDSQCELVVAQIFEEGLRCAERVRVESHGQVDFPLCWTWHDKVYLGAAHGIAGILYTLLLFVPQLQRISSNRGLDLVLRTVVYLVENFSHPSGNLFSSARSRPARSSHSNPPDDRLVQWCHGAPGVVHLLCLVAERFEGRREWCLEQARRACQCVWERGLLRKGVGLCHGISGNAYCFVTYARALSSFADVWQSSGEIVRAAEYRERSDLFMLRYSEPK